ncbi:MAG: signal peptidase I [Paenisporosarcina sp.]
MSSFKQELWEWMKAIVLGLVVVMLIRTFLLTNYEVSGESMMPILQDQDKVIVSKIAYTLGEIDRLDVLVFHGDENEDYVKRVIGIPGDIITYENDQLYINKKTVDEPYLRTHPAYINPDENLTEDFTLESLTGSIRVPEDSYFVLGDNRRYSLDSRYFKFVKADQVVGQVVLRYWPFPNLTINFMTARPE